MTSRPGSIGERLACALWLLLAAPFAADAATVYHSPQDDGVEGATVLIPDTGVPVAIKLWVRPTPAVPVASPLVDYCAGTADPNTAGDEVCMWDVHVVGTGEIVFDSFTPAAGVVSNVDSGAADPILRANGGDPADPNSALQPEPIGVLMVSAPAGGTGEVQVTGNLYVTTLLAALPVDGTPGGQPLGLVDIDSDGDGVPDGADNCPSVANAGQAASAQDGLVGFGCACLCGDVNSSCTVSGVDAQDIQLQMLANLGGQSGCYQLGSPDDQGLCGTPQTHEVRGCDANGSGSCSGSDAQVIQHSLAAISGTPTYPLPSGYAPTNCAQSTPDPIP